MTSPITLSNVRITVDQLDWYFGMRVNATVTGEIDSTPHRMRVYLSSNGRDSEINDEATRQLLSTRGLPPQDLHAYANGREIRAAIWEAAAALARGPVTTLICRIHAAAAKRGFRVYRYQSRGSQRQSNSVSYAVHPDSLPRPSRGTLAYETFWLRGVEGCTERCAAYTVLTGLLEWVESATVDI